MSDPKTSEPSRAANSRRGAFHSPAAVARLLLTAAVGLGLDLLTKVWAFRELVYNQVRLPNGSVQVQSHTYELLPGWLHFHCTANQGAVFGLGQGNRWLFVAISVLAIAFLFYLFESSDRRQRVYHVIVGMLLAGVLGNLYDRLLFGYVRDMIFILPGRTWPAWVTGLLPSSVELRNNQIFPWIFNVADSLLCCGVAFMLIYSFVMSRKHAAERGAEPKTSAVS